jgi:hypothetical protein
MRILIPLVLLGAAIFGETLNAAIAIGRRYFIWLFGQLSLRDALGKSISYFQLMY